MSPLFWVSLLVASALCFLAAWFQHRLIKLYLEVDEKDMAIKAATSETVSLLGALILLFLGILLCPYTAFLFEQLRVLL